MSIEGKPNKVTHGFAFVGDGRFIDSTLNIFMIHNSKNAKNEPLLMMAKNRWYKIFQLQLRM